MGTGKRMGGHPGVSFTCAYLTGPYANRKTGDTVYVNGGINIMG